MELNTNTITLYWTINPCRVPVTYIIDWGDGNTQEIESSQLSYTRENGIQHTYAQCGNYEVSLSVTNADSTTPFIINIDVENTGSSGIIDDFSANINGSTLLGTANFSYIGSSSTTFDIDWGDGTTDTNVSNGATHQYININQGGQTITLYANPSNCTQIYRETTVNCSPTVSNFTYTTQGNTVTIEYNIDGATSAVLYWGDGTNSIITTPFYGTIQHQYETGAYEAELHSTNSCGTTVSTLDIDLRNKLPVVLGASYRRTSYDFTNYTDRVDSVRFNFEGNDPQVQTKTVGGPDDWITIESFPYSITNNFQTQGREFKIVTSNGESLDYRKPGFNVPPISEINDVNYADVEPKITYIDDICAIDFGTTAYGTETDWGDGGFDAGGRYMSHRYSNQTGNETVTMTYYTPYMVSSTQYNYTIYIFKITLSLDKIYILGSATLTQGTGTRGVILDVSQYVDTPHSNLMSYNVWRVVDGLGNQYSHGKIENGILIDIEKVVCNSDYYEGCPESSSRFYSAPGNIIGLANDVGGAGLLLEIDRNPNA